MSITAQGNFVNGRFCLGNGPSICSYNPAKDYIEVFRVSECLEHIDEAVHAAHAAFPSWSALTNDVRIEHLQKLAAEFKAREAEIARAISLEMGKIYSESLAEAQNLSARVSLMAQHGIKRVAAEYPAGVPGETRYHAQGTLAVIGPYNFPVHLINAHVIPALITGNTVVVKPSEHCPLSGEIYASCFAAAGLPKGVFNLVQGGVTTSKALIMHPLINGVLFTGSYKTGRAIREMLLDQPHKQLALELGGKNFAVVLKDADLYQALAECINGAFLTTGQRCTATSRLLIAKEVAGQFIESLCRTSAKLTPKDPFDISAIFGPLANRVAFERYNRLVSQVREMPLDHLLEHRNLDGGAFVTPSIYQVRGRHLALPGYFDEEFFGPHLSVEIIDDLDDAIERINYSPYGLSNALFSASKSNFEHLYHETRVGVLNFNRSTNGASGQLPFGGVGKSGNQRAAGIDAVRYTTYPVAINTQAYGESFSSAALLSLLSAEENILHGDIETLAARHRIECSLERHRIKIADAYGACIYVKKTHFDVLKLDHKKLKQLVSENKEDYIFTVALNKSEEQYTQIEEFLAEISLENFAQLFHAIDFNIHSPKNGKMPESENWLNRLYCRQFVPKEKKSAVIDLHRSAGGYLYSIDEDPLIFLDAASQIATVGAGFQASTFRNALDEGRLNYCLAANVETTSENQKYSPVYQQAAQEISDFSELLLEHAWKKLQDVTFCSSGAEANEVAFALCRQYGPGGTRVIAFNGSFHGRTILSLQSTHSPDKRRGFEFKGYEATFIDFPINNHPAIEPLVSDEWIKAWATGAQVVAPQDDEVLKREIASLQELKKEIEKGNICCVIIEPMQSEGGDNYATARFFNGLRALTRGLNVPLVFDEVQTGFCLGGPFYWHSQFNLRNAEGEADGPDCVTLAKKAQLGAVLSAWKNQNKIAPHILQIARGHLQAKEMLAHDPTSLAKQVSAYLQTLQAKFPSLVGNSRVQAYAFAFDMPAKDLAMGVIEQRFYRGFMSYIAGEKTIRFRLNLATRPKDLERLFAGLEASLKLIQAFVEGQKPGATLKYSPPSWINTNTHAPRSYFNKSLPKNMSIEQLSLADFEKLKGEIEALEHAAYEPGRRDSIDKMLQWISAKDSITLAAYQNIAGKKKLCGYAFGGPLEHFEIDGPRQDIMRGKENTFYSANVLVAAEVQGQQLGLKLKEAQLSLVVKAKKSDGSARYDYMTGRNRVGYASVMSRITNAFGAYPVAVHDHQYGSEDAQALYYRINLRAPLLKAYSAPKTNELDWSAGIQAPFGYAPQELVEDIYSGQMNSAVATKLTLSNFVTPDFVRYVELVHHIAPAGLKHAYICSGRDEMVDKAVRSLRVARPQAEVVIGLSHQFFGFCTAAARSLSDQSGKDPTFKFFDWPHIPHPNSDGLKKSCDRLDAVIKQQGAERILAITVELVGEHSGFCLTPEFLKYLGEIRERHNIPLIFAESASAFGRNGKNFFRSECSAIKPNLLLWYTGAQLGHVFADDKYYVDKPLTLISTWDGDEISMRRNYHHILMAMRQISSSQTTYFSQMLQSLQNKIPLRGDGFWQVMSLRDEKTRNHIYDRCYEQGLLLRKGLPNTAVICPPINISKEAIDKGVEILSKVISEVVDNEV